MKISTLFLLLCFALNGFSQQILEDDIYGMINDRKLNHLDDSTNNKYYLEESSHIRGDIGKIDSTTLSTFNEYLLDSDIESMVEQFKGNELFKWDESKMKYANTLTEDELNALDAGVGFYTITKPVFSVNKKYAVVKLKYWCGNLCGEGGTILYEKKQIGWEPIERRGMWIN